MRLFYSDEAPIDTLLQIAKGPVADGDLISKSARDELEENGLVVSHDGKNWLTLAGSNAIKALGLKRPEEPVLPYQDRNHEGNSAKYHSKKRCYTKGCQNPAGTWWSPYWCVEHNIERMDRISANLEGMVERAKLFEAVDKAVQDVHEITMNLYAVQRAMIIAAGGTIVITPEIRARAAKSSSGSYNKNREGVETYHVYPSI